MSLRSKKIADLDPSSTVKAAKRARDASAAAAANAQNAAQNAALTAQNAAGVAQTAAQNAAVVAQTAAQNAGVIAQNAAQNASEAAQTAATGVSKGVKQGVYTARSWAAPRLESAADRFESAASYATTTVAPKVSSALRTTARQVSPADTSSKKRSALTWSLLGAAIAAALGAAAVLVRYRYRTAIAADTETADEEEVLGDSTGSQPAPVNPDGTPPAAAAPNDPKDAKDAKTDTGKNDPGSETPVNGRVATSGW